MSDDETISMHGWCASFCDQATSDEYPVSGQSVEDHSAWCRSRAYGAEGIDRDGERLTLYAQAVSRYTHGTYTMAEQDLNDQLKRRVGLTLGNAVGPELLLSPGEARQLAAVLVHLADTVSGTRDPLPRWIHTNDGTRVIH